MAKNTPSAPAAKTSTAQSAAPGAAGDPKAKKDKVKKDKVARTAFLAEGDAKLKHNDERLAKFDSKTHKKLKPSDFESRSEALRWKATQFDAAAARLRTEADRLASLGAIADNKKAKRLLALTSQIEELKKSLADEGQDVSALLAQMGITPAAN